MARRTIRLRTRGIMLNACPRAPAIPSAQWSTCSLEIDEWGYHEVNLSHRLLTPTYWKRLREHALKHTVVQPSERKLSGTSPLTPFSLMSTELERAHGWETVALRSWTHGITAGLSTSGNGTPEPCDVTKRRNMMMMMMVILLNIFKITPTCIERT